MAIQRALAASLTAWLALALLACVPSPPAPAAIAGEDAGPTQPQAMGGTGAGDGAPDATSVVDANGIAQNDGEVAASTDAAPVLAPLIDHNSWRTTPAELDPLPDHQPELIACVDGFRVDLTGPYLDLETAECNYLMVEHPAAFAVPAGSPMQLSLWHFDLSAREPAEAHLALLVGDTLLWEVHLPVPSPASAIDVNIEAPRSIAAGEPLRVHLHNHGQNSYVLSALLAEPP